MSIASTSQIVNRAPLMLLYLPVLNLLFISVNKYMLGELTVYLFVLIVILVIITALLTYVYCVLCEYLFTLFQGFSLPIRDDQLGFWAFSVKYAVIFSFAAWSSAFLLRVIEPHFYANPNMVGVVVFAVLQLLLIASVRTLLKQQAARVLLEGNYAEARLSAVKSQLNPHFLFNTLNMISDEVMVSAKMASSMIDELSDLLRGVLRASQSVTHPLEKETSILRHYLSLQSQRFGDKFQYNLSIDPSLYSIAVPTLVLQPIVENVLNHGWLSHDEPLRLSVSTQVEQGMLNVCIQDNGVGFDVSHLKSGHGLAITRDQLTLLYGDEHRFEIESELGKGTTITLALPVKL